MTQYELPDGFQGMETAPESGRMNVCFSDGEYGALDAESVLAREGARVPVIGWAPIVPLKRKARFVVKEFVGGCGPYVIHDDVNIYRIAERIPTRDAAQRIADIYNEVMP